MAIKNLIRSLKYEGMTLLEDEPMRLHTTLRIGGPVSAFVHVRDIEELQRLLLLLKESSIRYMVVGGGSNIVWPDEEMEIFVLSLSGLRYLKRIDENTIVAGGGLPLAHLVRFTVREGLQGLEGLLGIPGSVGGAIKGNAGAYGYEIKDNLRAVRIITREGVLKEFKKDELTFDYRSSSFTDDDIIVEAEFYLKKNRSRDLESMMRDYLHRRRQSQPINLPSAGSVFKNPPGGFAGRLIDEAGCKGMRSGDMEVSMVHANFIVNRGRGTQKDFLTLLEEVQERVLRRFNILLEPEVKIIRGTVKCR
ncbi:MAG: UDP-N-acetylmuramate dehydrogenase [Thermodesulfovibrionales bacterium]